MKYTCGLYRNGADTLEAAQEAKLRFIASCLGVRGGETVLDVGTGWGPLAFFLAEEFGCRVVGVTPSVAQARYIRDRASERDLEGLVQVAECTAEGLDLLPGQFDAAALVGSIEHMPDHHHVLYTVARLLRRDGRLYLSASCYRNQELFREYANRVASKHVTDSVFGFATMRPLSELVAGVENAGLSLIGLTDLTGHYQRTIEDWLARIRPRSDIIDAQQSGLAADLTRYLETANTGWGYTTKHYAITAVRNRWGRPELPV
jgi:cyclopropane-fatty-acyl-phospholipid synthase